jgi:two-component system, NarL family, nitrate/nitrite response regulator NarL
MTESTSLLIVDDHPLFSDGFATMLRLQRPDWRLLRAYNSAEGCETLTANPDLDLVIVDIELPDRDGFDTIETMAQINIAVPRLIISGREDSAARARSQRSGASGFVDKRLPADRIVALIEQVLAGQSGFSEGFAALPELSARQFEVLGLLAEGHGNKEIRYRLNIAERTVRAHLTDIFQALGVQTRVQAILRAREMGLIR